MSIFPLGPDVFLRPATLDDLDALYRVCLETGDVGANATHLYNDSKLLGSVYVGPYVSLSPDFSFVLQTNEIAGYVLGALDTNQFQVEAEAKYWPNLQALYNSPRLDLTPLDLALLEVICNPKVTDASIVKSYPSHLHIDLLPSQQGRGYGKIMIAILLEELQKAGSHGVHLGVHPMNIRARTFYGKLGFGNLKLTEEVCIMAKEL